MTETPGLRVFISYSHGDEDYRVELEKHLALLKNRGVLSVWQDRRIVAGDEFDKVIASELDAADIILLLISVNFLASKYCWEIEQTRALARHEAGEAKVIPIILKHCDDWHSAPFGRLAAAPTDGKPIEDFSSWDKGFTNVARAIRLAAEQLGTKRKASPKPTVHEPASGNEPASGQTWRLPHEQNINFTGRTDLLNRLHDELMSGEPAALIQALSGLGGIGKSQTAIEYAYRHKDAYRLVWWLRAEEPASLAADFAALAEPLGLDVSDDQNQVIAAVRDRLGEEDGWLLIFDNAEDGGAVRPYLPLQRRGSVIITSRNPNWSSIAKPVPVELMTEEDAVALLLKNRTPSEADAARNLAEALGYLPLALAQANAYCEHVGSTFRAYLHLLRQREADLLAQPHVPDDYPVPVAAAWDLAFETIQTTEGAADLLSLLAYLAPDAFPKNLLTEHADELHDDLATIARDPFKLDQAIATLRRASLVEATDDTLSTHRLVQTVTRCRCQAAEAELGLVGVVIGLIRATLLTSGYDVRQRPIDSHLLAHATVAARRAERLEAAPEATGTVFNGIALYLQFYAAYDEALTFYQRAIGIGDKSLGSDNLNLCIWLDNLATLHYDRGSYDEGLPFCRRAIEVITRNFGPNHPELATRLSNLANLYSAKRSYGEAWLLYQRALKIEEEAFGPDHPDLAITLNNLGELYRNLNHDDEALPLFQRAIQIYKKSPDNHNLNLAASLNNLALLYRDQRRYGAAEPLVRHAIEIGEEVLGPDHPDLAVWLSTLALLQSDQRRFDEALPLYQRAYSIVEAKLSHDHRNFLLFRENYRACLRDAGRDGSAS